MAERGALVFITGLFVAILQLSPGQTFLHPDALLSLSFVCTIGFLAGAWLRRVRTDTQVVGARAAEEVHREAEANAVKAADEVRRETEQRPSSSSAPSRGRNSTEWRGPISADSVEKVARDHRRIMIPFR